MTGASWVRNVGKLIERGRRISSERANKRVELRARMCGTSDHKVSLGETFPAPYLRVPRRHARCLPSDRCDCPKVKMTRYNKKAGLSAFVIKILCKKSECKKLKLGNNRIVIYIYIYIH